MIAVMFQAPPLATQVIGLHVWLCGMCVLFVLSGLGWIAKKAKALKRVQAIRIIRAAQVAVVLSVVIGPYLPIQFWCPWWIWCGFI